MQEGSASGPSHSLEEKIDILTAQFSQLVQMLTPHETHQPSAETVEEEVEDFLSHHELEALLMEKFAYPSSPHRKCLMGL